MLALAIQRRLERGTTDEEIDALVARYRDEHGLLFTVDTLEFLARGGRIGRAKAFAGQLLNVKPILSIRDGEVLPAEARARQPQGVRRSSSTRSTTQTRDEPGAARRHRARRRAGADAQLEKMVRDLRPQAQIEMETTLGAVDRRPRRARHGRLLLVRPTTRDRPVRF